MLKLIVAVGIALSCSVSVLADYAVDRKAAVELAAAGKNEEAVTAFTKLAESATSDIQKSDALEQAVLCATRLKKYDLAMELSKQIPLVPVSKASQIKILSAERKWQEIVAKFKDEDIAAWPQSAAGDAIWLRGQAFLSLKNGEAAEKDLTRAVELLADHNSKSLALINLGDAYQLLRDDARALETYRKVYKTGNIYKQCQAAISAADVLARQKKPDDAVKELQTINLKAVESSYWRASIFRAHGDILAADPARKEEAAAKYKEALQVAGIPDWQKNGIEKALRGLQADAK